MRTSDYVKNFFNEEGKLVDQNGLLLTLNAEFLLKLHQIASFDEDGDNDGKLFERCLTEIRDKFSKISNKVPSGLSEGLWKFLFANYLVIARDEYFRTYAKDKFLSNKKKMLIRGSKIYIDETSLNNLANSAYEDYLSTSSTRKDKLAKPNKFLKEVCKSLGLKLSELTKDAIDLKYTQRKSNLDSSDKRGHEDLEEKRIILATFIKYRDTVIIK